MQTFRSAVDAYDELVAERLDVSQTDLRYLKILGRETTASPSTRQPAHG